MSGDLDAISTAIGRLQADNEQAQRSRDAMWLELRKMNEQLSSVVQLRRDVDAMQPHVDDWRQTKARGMGIVVGAGLAGGSLGAGLVNYLRSKFGAP